MVTTNAMLLTVIPQRIVFQDRKIHHFLGVWGDLFHLQVTYIGRGIVMKFLFSLLPLFVLHGGWTTGREFVEKGVPTDTPKDVGGPCVSRRDQRLSARTQLSNPFALC